MDKPTSMHLSIGEIGQGDTGKRTITGYAYTSDTDWQHGEDNFRFAPDSVKPWREHVPVYAYHDDHDVIGRLTSAEWDESRQGWKVALKIANTQRGSDMLALADDKALGGMSMFIDDIELSDELTDSGSWLITSAKCREISLVGHPAVPTAVLTGVALSAQEAAKNAKALRDEIKEFQEKETAMTDTPETPEAETMELSADNGPSIQPTPLIRRDREEPVPYPHLFGGDPGKNSWFADMEKANRYGDEKAKARLALHATAMRKRSMALAVTTDDFPPTDPPINQSLFYQTTPDPLNPLQDVVSTGSLALPAKPEYVPTYDPTGETNLVNPHVEGVEPALGDIGTFARTLVEPKAVSGKVAATREATFNPLTERIIWRSFEKARRRAIETDLAAMLDGLSLPSGQVKTIHSNAVGGGTARSVTDMLAVTRGLLFNPDGQRYSRLLLTQNTYDDLSTATDSTGRYMLNVSGQAVNSAGNNNGGYLDVGGAIGRPIWGVTNSYLIDPDVVHVLLSQEFEWTFDYEVAWVRYGFYQASMMFVTDKRGIVRLTRATS